MTEDDKLYLDHIADRIERIEHYTADGRDAFLGSTLLQDAVIRSFEVIGEAVRACPTRSVPPSQASRGDRSRASETS